MSRKILIIDEFEMLSSHDTRNLTHFGLLVNHLKGLNTSTLSGILSEEVGYLVIITENSAISNVSIIVEKLAKSNPATPLILFNNQIDANATVALLHNGASFVYNVQPAADIIIATILSYEKHIQRRGGNVYTFLDLELNPKNQTVSINERNLALTRLEYSILLFLLKHPKQTVKKERLVENLWKETADDKSSYDFLYAHIKNLRKKLHNAGGMTDIKSVYGMGYKLVER